MSSQPASLCVLLSTNPTWDPLQLIEPNEKVYVLIRHDGATETQTKDETLRSLLAERYTAQQTLVTRKRLPKVDWLALCAGLCWAILFLSGSPWLPPTSWEWIDEINVLWNKDTPDLHCPALAGEFQSTKQHNQAQCQNPQLTRNLLFTFGSLLVELSLGVSLEDLRPKIYGKAPAGSTFGNDATLNEQAQKVYDELGYTYGDAVQRCLKCSFPGSDATHSFEYEQFRLDFFKGVVVPVQATYQHMVPRGSKCKITG
ncbi:Uu.00g139040.m01.CDS01 [Anthostomella pinea]|uniref:Uu.00g139040.m01.CDS01 n=1 Tax=Anthostomella pinea TaxID=933095 RepID=A0AAI8VQR2_9PEZI|nr:Uu.00g139040.m01.CDS01 [Anthostomella pinea]